MTKLLQWADSIIVLVGVVTAIYMLRKENSKAYKFMMRMMFEIIDILDGKEINGQIKKLRKEAEKFNIDN